MIQMQLAAHEKMRVQARQGIIALNRRRTYIVESLRAKQTVQLIVRETPQGTPKSPASKGTRLELDPTRTLI